jgi:hypothetical protein
MELEEEEEEAEASIVAGMGPTRKRCACIIVRFSNDAHAERTSSERDTCFSSIFVKSQNYYLKLGRSFNCIP